MAMFESNLAVILGGLDKDRIDTQSWYSNYFDPFMKMSLVLNNGLSFQMLKRIVVVGEEKFSRSYVECWKPLNEHGTLGAGGSVAIDITQRKLSNMRLGLSASHNMKGYSLHTFASYQGSLMQGNDFFPALSLHAQAVLAQYGCVIAGKVNLWDKDEFCNATLVVAKQIDADSTLKFKLSNNLDADVSVTH